MNTQEMMSLIFVTLPNARGLQCDILLLLYQLNWSKSDPDTQSMET